MSLAEKLKMCRYCKQQAQLLNFGDDGYPYRKSYGPTYVCVPCQAWVGCHPGTTRPLGGLANAELRLAKQAAHAVFDPLWQRKIQRDGCSKSAARKAGYKWLSEQLGIPFEKTHIGYMSLEECQRVVAVCNAPRAAPGGRMNLVLSNDHRTGGCMSDPEERDLAHEADMRALMRQQLRDNISPEEAAMEVEDRDRLAELEDRAAWMQGADLDDYDEEDFLCERCRGDGMDPMCDYLLPCPECQGEQTP